MTDTSGGRSSAPAEPRLLAKEPARLLRPVVVGLGMGFVTPAVPLAVWWVPQATVYGLIIAAIAAIYVGFAVADGRPRVIAAESTVAVLFMFVATLGVDGSPWFLVVGLLGHGFKDLVQHRTGFVQGMRWWPPFCVAVDWVAGGILAIAILVGAQP